MLAPIETLNFLIRQCISSELKLVISIQAGLNIHLAICRVASQHCISGLHNWGSYCKVCVLEGGSE